jgi:Nucleotidyltransferase domain
VSEPDAAFQARAGSQLAALPGVQAVTLGGSRATGTAGPDSDWDFAIYYWRDSFHPESLNGLGWPGEIFPIGGWGGVFNGGAWLTAGQRRAGLRGVDAILAGLSAGPAALIDAAEQAGALLGGR